MRRVVAQQFHHHNCATRAAGRQGGRGVNVLINVTFAPLIEHFREEKLHAVGTGRCDPRTLKDGPANRPWCDLDLFIIICLQWVQHSRDDFLLKAAVSG